MIFGVRMNQGGMHGNGFTKDEKGRWTASSRRWAQKSKFYFFPLFPSPIQNSLHFGINMVEHAAGVALATTRRRTLLQLFQTEMPEQ